MEFMHPEKMQNATQLCLMEFMYQKKMQNATQNPRELQPWIRPKFSSRFKGSELRALGFMF